MFFVYLLLILRLRTLFFILLVTMKSNDLLHFVRNYSARFVFSVYVFVWILSLLFVSTIHVKPNFFFIEIRLPRNSDWNCIKRIVRFSQCWTNGKTCCPDVRNKLKQVEMKKVVRTIVEKLYVHITIQTVLWAHIQL